MKKLLALSMVIVLLAACGTTTDVPAVPTGEDNISGFVTALFALPIAEVEAMPDRNEVVMLSENVGYLKADEVAMQALGTAVKPYVTDKVIETLTQKAGNAPGLMFMIYEVGYTLKVDNVYTEPGKDQNHTAFALLELTDPNGQIWHGLVDLNLRLDDKGLVDYWRLTPDAELTLIALSQKAVKRVGQTDQLEHVSHTALEDTLLR